MGMPLFPLKKCLFSVLTPSFLNFCYGSEVEAPQAPIFENLDPEIYSKYTQGVRNILSIYSILYTFLYSTPNPSIWILYYTGIVYFTDVCSTTQTHSTQRSRLSRTKSSASSKKSRNTFNSR